MAEFRKTPSGSTEVLWAGAWTYVPQPAADEIERLRHEVQIWIDRYESVLADAQRMERSFDEAWRRDERDH